MRNEVIIKTTEEIEHIRESGRYLNELLLLLSTKAKAGVSLLELEQYAEDYLVTHHVKWAFKWYNWYPANLCLSVNDCVVHWIPNAYVLKNWDLLKIDCGILYKWGISDSAISLIIWWEMANPLWHKLIAATKRSLDKWILTLWPWKTAYDFSLTVATSIKNDGFSVIKTLTGHGVGNYVHEKPNIYNYPHPLMHEVILQPWMVLALEPITALTSTDVYMKKGNDWNLYCKQKDIWAQREYMVLITPTGYEILSWITDDIF